MDGKTFVLRNGHVIDPANNIDGIADIAVVDGHIAAVGLDAAKAAEGPVFDLSGCYITPGLVDSHVHCYYTAGMAKAWAGDYSLQPDFFSFRSGVTTLVDVGSSGSYNFSHFRATVIERSKTRIFALLNICDYGMSSLQVEQFPERNDIPAAVQCIEANRDIIKGIKIAHYWGKDWGDVDCAKKIQDQVSLPIMVDFGVFKKERPYDELVMERLSKGDISTHCFRCAVPVINQKTGKVYDYLWKARERGIYFDLGHGAASFMLRNAVPAMRQGFIPDTFSSDLHAQSINGTVMTMADLLSKVLACCPMTLPELFAGATNKPATMLKLGNGIGTLDIGADADIAVWNIRDGEFGFKDMSGGTIKGTKRLECEMTFRAGELVWDLNARDGVPFEKLPPLYGFDPAAEDLVEPTH